MRKLGKIWATNKVKYIKKINVNEVIHTQCDIGVMDNLNREDHFTLGYHYISTPCYRLKMLFNLIEVQSVFYEPH